MIHRNPGRLTRRTLAVALLVVLTGVACEDGTAPERDGQTRVALQADLVGTAANRLLVEVTAPDIPHTLSFDLEARGGVASGPLVLPVGSDRVVTMRALNADGLATHVGSAILDVPERSLPSTTVVLSSPIGAAPVIRATLAIFVVSIEPEVSELKIGESVQLKANVTDLDGRPLNGHVDWAVTQRQIADVSKKGLVEGVSPGAVTVTAEYKGTAGLARVFVAAEAEEYFVSAGTGDDGNVGTRAAPFATIQRGIDVAAARGTDAVVSVARGSYAESLVLRSQVSVLGGFDPETWFRDPEAFPTHVFGGPTAVSGDGVGSLRLEGLRIWSADADDAGESSVGIRLVDSEDVLIAHNVVVAGAGADGLAGANRTGAANGRPGERGFNGGVRLTRPGGGAGGGGATGSGSRGGDGGQSQVALLFVRTADLLRGDLSSSEGGEDGIGTAGAPGGPGGMAGSGYAATVWEAADTALADFLDLLCDLLDACDDEDDFLPTRWGGDGQSGTPGQTGAPGVNGAGGQAFGALVGGAYQPARGENGWDGQNGGGGGGGGGAGGQLVMAGGSGGGGGGGGAGGRGGVGGEGGGGSYGIVLARSTNIEIRANHIVTGPGGRGGAGGAGGTGGVGGPGGTGGTGGDPGELDFGIFNIPEGLAKPGGVGGDGGTGGNGGAGGAGGGGGGGPTIAIVEDRPTTAVQSGNTFELGPAGEGGPSRGIVPTKEGNRGAHGVRAEFAKLAGSNAASPFMDLRISRDGGD